MLNLRDQKRKEEEAQDAAARADMAAITSSLSSLGSSIGSAVSSYSQNTSANKLMNQATPPRAEAVTPGTTTYDPAINKAAAAAPLEGQIPYEQIPVTATPATGGKAELDMRLKMDAEARKRMDATINQNQDERRIGISQGHLDLAQQNAAGVTPAQQATAAAVAARAAEDDRRANSQKLVDDAKAAYGLSSEKYQGFEKDATAYNKNTQVVLDAINNAPDQKAYIDALGKLDSHHQAATAMGLKVEKPSIPSWESIQAAKEKQKQIDAANAGYYFSTKATEQADADKFTKELQGMPGYGFTEAGSRNVPLVEGNYLATPAMPAPTPPDYSAIRAGAPSTGQVAAPVTGATAAASTPTMSAAEYKAKTGEDVAPGTVKVDSKGRRLLITQ